MSNCQIEMPATVGSKIGWADICCYFCFSLVFDTHVSPTNPDSRRKNCTLIGKLFPTKNDFIFKAQLETSD